MAEVPGPGVQRGFCDPCSLRAHPRLARETLRMHQLAVPSHPVPNPSLNKPTLLGHHTSTPHALFENVFFHLGVGGGNSAEQEEEECKPGILALSHGFFFFQSTGSLDKTGIDVFHRFYPCLLGEGEGGRTVTFFFFFLLFFFFGRTAWM